MAGSQPSRKIGGVVQLSLSNDTITLFPVVIISDQNDSTTVNVKLVELLVFLVLEEKPHISVVRF